MGYQLIETIEVGAGGAASIEFTGIPQDGVDLVCVTSLRSDRASQVVDGAKLYPNGSSANGNHIYLSVATPSVPASGTGSRIDAGLGNASLSTSNTFSNGSVYISNYSGSTAKSFSTDAVLENNDTQAYLNITASLWNDTSAITSLEILSTSGSTLLQYSTASLYKITAD